MRLMRKMFVLLIAFAITVSISVSAYSAIIVPDITRTDGSINLSVVNTSGTPVSGGTFTLYYVARAVKDNANHYYAFTPEFASCGVVLSDYYEDVDEPGSMARSIRTDTDLVEHLVSYVTQNSISGMTVHANGEGVAQFQDLSMGLYLVIQHTPAAYHSAVSPFVITLPLWDEAAHEWVYQVEAAPKMDNPTYMPPPPEPTPTPEPPAEPTPTPVPSDPPKNEDTPDQPVTPGHEEGSHLPQTGQLWWPVWALAFGGVLLFSIGWSERRKETNEKES